MKAVTLTVSSLRWIQARRENFYNSFILWMPIATIVNIQQNLSSFWKKSDEQFATEVNGQRRRALSKKLKSKILMRMKNPLSKLMSVYIQSDHQFHPIHPKRQRVTSSIPLISSLVIKLSNYHPAGMDDDFSTTLLLYGLNRVNAMTASYKLGKVGVLHQVFACSCHGNGGVKCGWTKSTHGSCDACKSITQKKLIKPFGSLWRNYGCNCCQSSYSR